MVITDGTTRNGFTTAELMAEIGRLGKARGYSVTQLAAAIGVSVPLVKKLQCGQQKLPSIKFLVGVLKAFPELKGTVWEYIQGLEIGESE